MSAADVAAIKDYIDGQLAEQRTWFQNFADTKFGGTINREVADASSSAAAAKALTDPTDGVLVRVADVQARLAKMTGTPGGVDLAAVTEAARAGAAAAINGATITTTGGHA